MKELNIGDKVKAVRVFRNPDFRFDGVKEIIATDSYLDNEDSLGYILKGMEDAIYHRRDLIKV
jgi:hypothetical protein